MYAGEPPENGRRCLTGTRDASRAVGGGVGVSGGVGAEASVGLAASSTLVGPPEAGETLRADVSG